MAASSVVLTWCCLHHPEPCYGAESDDIPDYDHIIQQIKSVAGLYMLSKETALGK